MCLHFSTVSLHMGKKTKEKGDRKETLNFFKSVVSQLKSPHRLQSGEHPGRGIGGFSAVLTGKFSFGLLKYLLQTVCKTCRMKVFKSITRLNRWNLGPYIPCGACRKCNWQFQKHQHLVHLKVRCVDSDVPGIIQNILESLLLQNKNFCFCSTNTTSTMSYTKDSGKIIHNDKAHSNYPTPLSQLRQTEKSLKIKEITLSSLFTPTILCFLGKNLGFGIHRVI